MIEELQTRWGTINRQGLADLKAGYTAAKAAGQTEFTILGVPYLTSFAGYLIEWCEANGLVAADSAMCIIEMADLGVGELHGAPIARGQEIISKFFEGIAAIAAFSEDHIAIYKKGSGEPVAIIGSPELAKALRDGVGN